MADPIKLTDDLRGFTQLLYSETATAILQMMQMDELPEQLQLDSVRVRCGSHKVNRVEDGFSLPDNTPWLAELHFGKAESSNRTKMINAPNTLLMNLTVSALQGVGPKWEKRMNRHNLISIKDIADSSKKIRYEIQKESGSSRIIEFYSKARTVATSPPPLPRSALDELPLHEVVWLSPAEATTLAADTIDPQDWDQVSTYVSTLYGVLNDQVLHSLTLRNVL